MRLEAHLQRVLLAVLLSRANRVVATTVLHDACATLDLEFNGVKVPAEQVHAAFMAALRFGYAPVISTAEYLQAL